MWKCAVWEFTIELIDAQLSRLHFRMHSEQLAADFLRKDLCEKS